jgi:hypothetical protein
MIMMIIYHENIYVVCALCNGEKILIWSYETFLCVKHTVQGAPFMEADPITWSRTAKGQLISKANSKLFI